MASSKYAYWAFAAAGPLVLYCLCVGLLMIPFVQRQYVFSEKTAFFTAIAEKSLLSAVYAHRVHTLWWSGVDKPEKWGFASKSTSLDLSSPFMASQMRKSPSERGGVNCR